MLKLKTLFGLVSMVCVSTLVACAGETGDDDEQNPTANADDELSTKSIKLAPNGSSTFTLKATKDSDVTVSIDCHASADPDDVGTVFKVSAPTLGATSASDPARSDLWSWTGHVTAGTHTITFANQGPGATCAIKSGAVAKSATCKTGKAWRSVNTNHTHFRVGTDTSSDWESFPASGNHWGAWATWTQDYPKPVKKGFFLHNMEHGGIVFSYKCSSATQSAECQQAHDALLAVANDFGQARVIITPDPTQPEMFAIRAWRTVFSSSCLDDAAASAFLKAHFRHGREDIEDSPPIPFDPTTTNVPCQDLMAAPDSCN